MRPSAREKAQGVQLITQMLLHCWGIYNMVSVGTKTVLDRPTTL